jgi:hypothetical protein
MLWVAWEADCLEAVAEVVVEAVADPAVFAEAPSVVDFGHFVEYRDRQEVSYPPVHPALRLKEGSIADLLS